MEKRYKYRGDNSHSRSRSPKKNSRKDKSKRYKYSSSRSSSSNSEKKPKRFLQIILSVAHMLLSQNLQCRLNLFTFVITTLYESSKVGTESNFVSS